jgi:Fe-S oxidoreductase/nitrate reductase gamma subunit
MNPALATREIYWNIDHHYIWLMYMLFLVVLLVGGNGVYRRVRLWRQGKPLARFDRPAERIGRLIVHALVQSRTAVDVYAGFFHRMIFYGFLVLIAATTIVALDADMGIKIMHGPLYLYFQSFTVDVFGALVLLGILMATGRRYLQRPRRLIYTSEAGRILCLLGIIILTGFLLHGWRIAATADPWASYSPFSNLVAKASLAFMSQQALITAHRFTWWFHLVLCFSFLAWIPYTKMMHLLTGPLNIYTSNLKPVGASLKDVDFESAESFGVNALTKFTWKDLLDLDACTECGRCTDNCPANTVGKELSPRDIILQLRDLMHAREREVFGLLPDGSKPAPFEDGSAPADAPVPLAIIGAVAATSPEALWQCTTCAACMQACPVFIEQMPKIVDMRRYLVMEQAEMPETMQEASVSLENRSQPFRGTQSTRVDWADGLNVPTIGETEDAEVLFFVGCGGALLERNQKVVRATAQLLQKAGVKFAILGREEKCCGDPARRMGNEFLFENLAKKNIEAMNGYKVKKIVTACPHCMNTLRNEYPRLGGDYEVYHHSEYLAGLVESGKLQQPSSPGKKITFHDPCYLGRHNGQYEAPRQLVQLATGKAATEMDRNHAKSFCCGGGGGMSFVDEPPTQRVNRERAREALETGAGVVAVACPFCMTMMEDGINAAKGEREVRVMDVAELMMAAQPQA